jgi:hypothetical protein
MTEPSEIAALHRDINRYQALRRSCSDPWMRVVLADAINEAKERLETMVKEGKGAG